MKHQSPLSPHLQVYKWQLSSLLSITHRMTSIFNLLGLTIFAIWIFLLFIGENTYNYFEVFASSLFGKFIFVGITWSFSYHMLNGIRHLFWDMGYGYEIKTANLSGILVLCASFILTLLVWIT
tara:strand:- start:6417 stop:6785 length:369 start_codon:yes stop_codon:yes gene_type:complete